LLELSILFWGESSGKIAGLRREIHGKDQTRLQGIARGGEINEQAPEVEQILQASAVGTREDLVRRGGGTSRTGGDRGATRRAAATVGNRFGDRRGSDGQRRDSDPWCWVEEWP